MEHLDFRDLDHLADLLRRYSVDPDAGILNASTALELEHRVGDLANRRRLVAIIDDNHRCASMDANGPGDAHLVEVTP